MVQAERKAEISEFAKNEIAKVVPKDDGRLALMLSYVPVRIGEHEEKVTRGKEAGLRKVLTKSTFEEVRKKYGLAYSYEDMVKDADKRLEFITLLYVRNYGLAKDFIQKHKDIFYNADGTENIEEIASFLAAAHKIGLGRAKKLVENYGAEWSANIGEDYRGYIKKIRGAEIEAATQEPGVVATTPAAATEEKGGEEKPEQEEQERPGKADETPKKFAQRRDLTSVEKSRFVEFAPGYDSFGGFSLKLGLGKQDRYGEVFGLRTSAGMDFVRLELSSHAGSISTVYDWKKKKVGGEALADLGGGMSIGPSYYDRFGLRGVWNFIEGMGAALTWSPGRKVQFDFNWMQGALNKGIQIIQTLFTHPGEVIKPKYWFRTFVAEPVNSLVDKVQGVLRFFGIGRMKEKTKEFGEDEISEMRQKIETRAASKRDLEKWLQYTNLPPEMRAAMRCDLDEMKLAGARGFKLFSHGRLFASSRGIAKKEVEESINRAIAENERALESGALTSRVKENFLYLAMKATDKSIALTTDLRAKVREHIENYGGAFLELLGAENEKLGEAHNGKALEGCRRYGVELVRALGQPSPEEAEKMKYERWDYADGFAGGVFKSVKAIYEKNTWLAFEELGRAVEVYDEEMGKEKKNLRKLAENAREITSMSEGFADEEGKGFRQLGDEEKELVRKAKTHYVVASLALLSTTIETELADLAKMKMLLESEGERIPPDLKKTFEKRVEGAEKRVPDMMRSALKEFEEEIEKDSPDVEKLREQAEAIADSYAFIVSSRRKEKERKLLAKADEHEKVIALLATEAMLNRNMDARGDLAEYVQYCRGVEGLAGSLEELPDNIIEGIKINLERYGNALDEKARAFVKDGREEVVGEVGGVILAVDYLAALLNQGIEKGEFDAEEMEKCLVFLGDRSDVIDAMKDDYRNLVYAVIGRANEMLGKG
ncbi:MAG: hypothetical protein AB1468_01615 [Candidatus Micrarchaeota archaeon]